MKKFVCAMAALFACSAIATNIPDIKSDGIYAMTAQVYCLDYEADIVTIEDANGNLWDFEGCEDYCEGDLVSCVMWDAGTPETVYDDHILSARFSGFWVSD